jgi:hypothetical protein
MDTKRFTLADWREFMNGYRDPKTRAEDRQRLRQEFEDAGEDFDDWSGGDGGGGFGATGERECGSRVEGGTYAVVPTSPNGTPIDNFLLCKPMIINREEYNLSNVGVRLVDVEQVCSLCAGDPKFSKGVLTCDLCFGLGTETVTHIFDIVGQEYYPNVADFVEEARRLGISRRLELETANEYARLTPRSRLFLLHHRAGILNPKNILTQMQETERERLYRAGCPKGLAIHSRKQKEIGDDWINYVSAEAFNPPGCSALYWNVLEEGASLIPEFDEINQNLDETGNAFRETRFAERKLKSGSYRGYTLPLEVKPDYTLAVFGIFPLGRLEVINSGGEYDDRVDRASSARVDIEEVDC